MANTAAATALALILELSFSYPSSWLIVYDCISSLGGGSSGTSIIGGVADVSSAEGSGSGSTDSSI
jgi:hypothetical protein